MTVYCECVRSVDAGGTADTWTELGTITLRSDARQLLGVLVNAAIITRTAIEPMGGQIKVSCPELKLGEVKAACQPYHGNACATNPGMAPSLTEFIPILQDVVGNARVTVSFSTHIPSPTAGCSVIAGVVYVAGPPNASDDWDERFPEMAPIAGGADSEADDTILAASYEALTALEIPGAAEEIVGFKIGMSPGEETAGEESIGEIDFRSTIPDFGPQNWPIGIAYSASLGTPTESPQTPSCPAYGVSIPLPSPANETIVPYARLNVARTVGNQVSCTVFYR